MKNICANCGAQTHKMPCHNCGCNNGRVNTADEATANDVLKHLRRLGKHSASDFSKLHSISGPRLRKLVRQLREEGIPVLSDRRGYWLSVDPAEINAFCRRSEQRAAAILRWCGRLRQGGAWK